MPFLTKLTQFQPKTVTVPLASGVHALALMVSVNVPEVAPAFKQVKVETPPDDWVSSDTTPLTIASVSDDALTVAASAMEKIGFPPKKVIVAVVVERDQVHAKTGENVTTSPATAVIA